MTRIHRADAKKIWVGVVAVVLGLVVAYIGLTTQLGGNLPGKRYTDVRVAFDNVGALKKNQEVSQNGVRVGQVTGIEYVDGEAVVTLRLDGDRTVYQDASAYIGSESTFGRKYVDLDPGTSDAGPLGSAVLPADRTVDSQDLDQILKAFGPSARQGLQTMVRELGAGALGQGINLNDFLKASPDLLADLETVLMAVNSPEDNLQALLTAADDFTASLRGRDDTLRRLLAETSGTLDALDVDDSQPLQATLAELPVTLAAARDGLAALESPLRDVNVGVRELGPGARALGAATPDLRGFLVEARTPLGKVPDISEAAVPAVRDLDGLMARLGPLADRVRTTFASSGPLLDDLRPFLPDAGRMFANYELLSGAYAPDKHFFSAELATPGLYAVGLPDPLIDYDPYPGPGNAWGPGSGR